MHKNIIFAVVSCVLASAQTFTGLTVDPSVKNWDAGGLCPKARNFLEAAHTNHIVVEMYIDSDGKVSSYNFVQPKGLHLKNDPDIRQAFKQTLRFVPLRLDGQPTRAVVNMDVNCSSNPPETSLIGPRR